MRVVQARKHMENFSASNYGQDPDIKATGELVVLNSGYYFGGQRVVKHLPRRSDSVLKTVLRVRVP